MTQIILRLEGAMIGLLAGALVWQSGPPLWLALVVLILPDVSMLGYLVGPRFGAYCYNAMHTTVLPLIIGGLGLFQASVPWVEVSLLWLLHIGADRALGYGLKEISGFKSTHLGTLRGSSDHRD